MSQVPNIPGNTPFPVIGNVKATYSRAPLDATLAQYDLAFQRSPIILEYGIAAQYQGGLVPISYYTPAFNSTKPEEGARYLIAPGSTLISQTVGMYPFANQSVAANATIEQPLTISLIMVAPVNTLGGYNTKLQTLSNLQYQLTQHNALGGMYIIATPAFIYRNCLLTGMTDITPEESKQKQIEFQLDFIQPLLTHQQATQALNTRMSQINAGTKMNMTTGGSVLWSGDSTAYPAGDLTGNQASLAGIESALAAFGGYIGGNNE